MAKNRANKSDIRMACANETPTQVKKLCILKGLDFQSEVEWGVIKLSVWYENNMHLRSDKKLLAEFDLWIKKELMKKCPNEVPYLCHKDLNMGEDEEEFIDKVITKEKKVKKEKGPKREKDEVGLIKGTKKSYVFELVRKGKSEDYIKKRLNKKFGEFNESSFRTWFLKAKKLNG